MDGQLPVNLEWSRTRKVLVALLVMTTLGVGILIGTVMNSQVAARPQSAPEATALAMPSPVQLSSHFASIE